MTSHAQDHLFTKDGGLTSHFLVEIGGKPFGRFTECHGLEVEIEVETYQEGGHNGYVHKLPGRMSWPNLVLKRGITWDDEVLDWFNKSVGSNFLAEGKAERKPLSVILMSVNRKENSEAGDRKRLRTWTFHDAIPVKWTGPRFGADADEVPTEELEIAHHGFVTETHQ